jgi:hypothetical protein
MGYRKYPVLAFAFLCDLCGFAVRNWQLLALSHPRRAGSGAKKENG